MKSIDKLVEKLYEETDVARSVATSLAGLAGLIVYLLVRDWVVALFSWLIVFPVSRLIAALLHEKHRKRSVRRESKEEAEMTYGRLSTGEKEVVQAFVTAGGAVMTVSHINSLSLNGPSVESLMHRGLLSTSMTADCMRETLVLEPAILDAGVSRGTA